METIQPPIERGQVCQCGNRPDCFCFFCQRPLCRRCLNEYMHYELTFRKWAIVSHTHVLPCCHRCLALP